MKKAFFIPISFLLMLLLTTTVFAAGGLTAARTDDGMQVDGSSVLLNVDGHHFCAVYNADGRMLAITEVTDPADIHVPCDADAVRTVRVFAYAEDSCLPLMPSVETTLEDAEAPEEHIHTWDEGTVLFDPTCDESGRMVYTCTAADCSETPNATYTEDIAPTGHLWNPWRRKDNDTHIRECFYNNSHTETAPHNFQLMEIIKEPTTEQEGTAIYFCPDCRIGVQRPIPKLEPKEVWFAYDTDQGEYMLNWLPADELPSGHGYFVNGRQCYPNEIYYPNHSCYVSISQLNLNLADITATTDIVIETGTWSARTPLYTAEDALVVTEGEAAGFTLTGQTDGTYLVGADADLTGMTVNAKLIHDDGKTELVRETYDSPNINIYPWDGSTIELSAMICTISEDTESLIISRTPAEKITTFIRPAAPADRIVTTAEELQTALTVGGKVTLGADISADYMDIYGGEPVTLDLNGHTLTLSQLWLRHGKEATILGTTLGSALVGEIHTAAADKLTIHGGSYDALSLEWINEITLEDAAFTSDESTAIYASDCFDITMTGCTVTSAGNNAMTLDRGDTLTIEDSTLSTTGVPSASYMRYEALTTAEIGTIRLINVTASSVSGSAVELSPAPAYGSSGEPYSGSSVFVRGGSYTSECTNISAAALQIKDFESVEIGGVISPAADPDDLLISSACHGIELQDVTGTITLSDITAQTIGEGTGLYDLFYMHKQQTATPGGAVNAIRLTGNGGRAHTLRVEDRTSLTLEQSSFTAPDNTNRTPAAISIERVGTVTIDRTNGAGGYYSLYIFDCDDVDLSNMDLRDSSTFALNACNIADFDATACEIYGDIYCWKNGNYTFTSDCWLVGDVEANGDSGYFVTVDITGCFLSGTTCTNQYSTILK